MLCAKDTGKCVCERLIFLNGKTLGTYVRIHAGSETGLGGEWHVYFSERKKVTEVGAVIPWRNQKSKTNCKAKTRLQLCSQAWWTSFVRDAVLEAGTPKMSVMFVTLGLIAEGWRPTCVANLSKDLRDAMSTQYLPHIFSVINISPKLILRFYSSFFFGEIGYGMTRSLTSI